MEVFIMGCGSKIKKETSRATSQISKETRRAGDTLEKVGTAAVAGAIDPGAWMGYLVSPIAGQAMGGQSARDNYEALSEAEKEEARAAAEQRMAEAEEKRLMQEQEDAQREQERMTSERAKSAEAEARSRAKRIGSGRRGLLYGGETGVKKDTVLGG